MITEKIRIGEKEYTISEVKPKYIIELLKKTFDVKCYEITDNVIKILRISYNGKQQKEIARQLEISEPRISKIFKKVLSKLKNLISECF